MLRVRSTIAAARCYQTGFSSHLETGTGLFRRRTVAEALEALAQIEDDYHTFKGCARDCCGILRFATNFEETHSAMKSASLDVEGL